MQKKLNSPQKQMDIEGIEAGMVAYPVTQVVGELTALDIQLDLLNDFIAGCNIKMINLAWMLGGFFYVKKWYYYTKTIRRLIKQTTGI